MKSVVLKSLLIALGVSSSLSSCKKDKEFEEGQRGTDDLVTSVYKNEYTREQFLERAKRDLDPLLNEFWQAFSISPDVLTEFAKPSLEAPSALGALRAFSMRTRPSSLPSLESIDDFANISFYIPKPNEPNIVYLGIRKGHSCELATRLVETGYPYSVDYGKKIIHAADVTDENNAPAGVKVYNSKTFAKIYVVNLNAENDGVSSNGEYRFSIGGSKNVLDMQASGNLKYDILTTQRNLSLSKALSFQMMANTTNKNMDIASGFNDYSAEICPSKVSMKVENSFSGTYYSTIALGKEPKVTDGLFDKSDSEKAGYRILAKNQNCPGFEESGYANILLDGIFKVTVTKPSPTELKVVVNDIIEGTADTQPVKDTITTEWTLVNDGSSCTVSRVVQNGQEIQ